MKTAMSDDRFPILKRRYDEPREYVPWSFVAAHERQAQINHYQSLERLAERGGLSWPELCAVIEDRRVHKMDVEVAKATVLAALEAAT